LFDLTGKEHFVLFQEGNMNVVPHKTIKYNDPWIYTYDPPWTDLAQRKNDPRQGQRRPQLIEPLRTWDFFRGDVVCSLFYFYRFSILNASIG
jgi:hypothetical protein